jgi:hypothetical protein
VIELGRCPGLYQKTLHVFGAGFLGQIAVEGNDFHRDMAVKDRVAGQIHPPHPPFTDTALNFVAPECPGSVRITELHKLIHVDPANDSMRLSRADNRRPINWKYNVWQRGPRKP